MVARPVKVFDLLEPPWNYVVGSYLYPLRFFSDQPMREPIEATDVIRKLHLGAFDVSLTRSGGMFVPLPPDLAIEPGLIKPGLFDRRETFASDLSRSLTLLACELSVQGMPTEPISPTYVVRGNERDDRAVVIWGGGAGPIQVQRQVGAFIELLTWQWQGWPRAEMKALDAAAQLRVATPLALVGGSLPALVAAAYHQYAHRELAEACADAWIVAERVLSVMWDAYVATLPPSRRERLRDDRTYSAAVRLEMLRTTGRIEPEVYEEWSAARVARNHLLHRGELSVDGAKTIMSAMRSAIQLQTGVEVTPPGMSSPVLW